MSCVHLELGRKAELPYLLCFGFSSSAEHLAHGETRDVSHAYNVLLERLAYSGIWPSQRYEQHGQICQGEACSGFRARLSFNVTIAAVLF